MILYGIGIAIACIGGVCLGLWVAGMKNDAILLTGVFLVAVGFVITIVGSFLGKKKVKPNRSFFDLPFTQEAVSAEERLREILAAKGFTAVQYGEETVYKLGSGFWTARKFIRYSVFEDKIVLGAWVSIGMGDRPNTELPLDNRFTASLPKKQLKKIVDDIVAIFGQENGTSEPVQQPE